MSGVATDSGHTKKGNYKMDKILSQIFEVCLFKIKGVSYRIKFTLSSALFLEQRGIKPETFANMVSNCPMSTIFTIIFAGLPREHFRDKMSFDEFIESLNDKEKKDIVSRSDVLLTAYFRDFLLKTEKTKKAIEVMNANKHEDGYYGIKKNYLN